MSKLAGTTNLVPNVLIEVFDSEGNLRETRVCNLVTSLGKAGAADQILASPTLGKPTHIAVGSGTPSGTALGAEIDRNALTSKTRSGATVTMVVDFGAGEATGALTEAGVFDASSSGSMWMSTTYAPVNLTAQDTVRLTWGLTFS